MTKAISTHFKASYFSCLLTFFATTNFAFPATSENFDTLSNAAGKTSSALPMGWKFLEVGSNDTTTYLVDAGSTTSGNTLSLGASNSSDRAFGTLLSGSSSPNAATIGATYALTAAASSVTITYTGEQWRRGTNQSAPDQLLFYYAKGNVALTTPSSSITSNPATLGAYTSVSALNFSSPQTTITAGALDGNSAANRTTGITATITGLNLSAGDLFTLEFVDFNVASSDDSLGVDDFTISASSTDANLDDVPINPAPEPTSALLASIACVPFLGRRGRSSRMGKLSDHGS